MVKVITVRTSGFEAVGNSGGAAVVRNIADFGYFRTISVLTKEVNKSGPPSLAAVKIIVSDGRGLDSSEKFNEVIIHLADILNAFVGAG
jgi:electron transfer flavoprotein alpha subunit